MKKFFTSIGNAIKGFYTWLRQIDKDNNRVFFRHAAVVFLLIFVALMLFIFCRQLSNNQRSHINETLNLNSLSSDILQRSDCACSSLTSDSGTVYLNQINKRYTLINHLIQLHFNLAGTLYSYSIAFNSVATIFAILAAVFLLLVILEGLKTANKYLLTAFITTAGISLFCSNFPLILNLKSNIDSNEQLFGVYLGMKREVQAYVLQCKIELTGDSHSASMMDATSAEQKVIEVTLPFEFISYLDHKLLTTFKMPVYMDESKLKDAGEYFKTLNQSMKQQ